MSTVIDNVYLLGCIRSFKEWYEGYDHWEAIAFSFVVEFNEGRDNWSMFADSEEEKVNRNSVSININSFLILCCSQYRILGLFKIAGGLDA